MVPLFDNPLSITLLQMAFRKEMATTNHIVAHHRGWSFTDALDNIQLITTPLTEEVHCKKCNTSFYAVVRYDSKAGSA